MKIYKRLFEAALPKIGSVVTLGDKRKRSSWGRLMRKGTKMIVLDNTDHINSGEGKGEPVLTLAFASEYKKPGFDPEMDYEIVYPDEVK